MLRGALGYARIPPPRTDAATAAQLGRIGGNLWQLIREIRNGRCHLDEAVIEEIRQEILSLRRSLLKVSLEEADKATVDSE